eukprot:TRINITY_DN8874_c1_g1_i2.p2 TRINITY_DN8874_c1_g1~~TRINITY_DN8874_c1_g1_i2.p2  ORF type:complete len:219 (-),score=53.33 TRINITY_DN8874_c1_g1_i2:421-1077(-)
MLGKKSRGQVLTDFLLSDEHPVAYIKRRVASDVESFNGFNVVCGDVRLAMGGGPCAWYFGTHHEACDPVPLLPGRVYGLSNAVLDSPWCKVERGKAAFQELAEKGEASNDEILAIMHDQNTLDEDDPRLPSTGVSPRSESAFSSIFVANRGHEFNTLCTCVLSASLPPPAAHAPISVDFSEWTYPSADPATSEFTSASFQVAAPACETKTHVTTSPSS